MAKIHVGYKLRDPNGSFHDPILGLSASHDEIVPIQTGKKTAGTNYQRWITRGGLVPVFVEEADPARELVKTVEAKTEPPPSPPVPKVDQDYEVMTKTQLLDLIKKLGLPSSLARKSRQDLIELLSAHKP